MSKITITDEILIAANTIANAGKKPTVALVKAKLTQQAPLPLLISTLKNWQHQPDFIAISNEVDKKTSQSFSEFKDNLLENSIIKSLIQEAVAEELKQVKIELSDIKTIMTSMNKQLKTINKN